MTATTTPAITVGGREYAERAAQVIAAAFSGSTFTAYLLRTPESTWPTSKIPEELIGPHFQKNILKKLEYGGEIVEAGDWAAAAVWFPPGASVPAPSDSDARIEEYREVFSKAKKEHLQGREYWYLNLIGRHPDRTQPGVIRALIDPYLKKAREQGLPLWLEAISEHGKQVYEHLGFRTVMEARLGVGRVNSNGELTENGDGILVYGMMAE